MKILSIIELKSHWENTETSVLKHTTSKSSIHFHGHRNILFFLQIKGKIMIPMTARKNHFSIGDCFRRFTFFILVAVG